MNICLLIKTDANSEMLHKHKNINSEASVTDIYPDDQCQRRTFAVPNGYTAERFSYMMTNIFSWKLFVIKPFNKFQHDSKNISWNDYWSQRGTQDFCLPCTDVICVWLKIIPVKYSLNLPHTSTVTYISVAFIMCNACLLKHIKHHVFDENRKSLKPNNFFFKIICLYLIAMFYYMILFTPRDIICSNEYLHTPNGI